jgi:FtsH-binding integral membrane protein
MNQGYANPYVVANATDDARAAFIKNTYLHLAGAIGVFALLEAYLLNSSIGLKMAQTMMSGSWLLVLGGFMLVSFVADRWARSDTSRGQQYLGLGLFVVAEAIIFLPLMFMAQSYAARSGSDVIGKAAITTGILVAGLTVTAFVTKKDFSFMRSFLVMGSFVALGLIVASVLFKFELGILFSGAMVLFASASILYTTSNIIHQYRADQYVSAALALFSGVALLFWYILQIFMRRD